MENKTEKEVNVIDKLNSWIINEIESRQFTNSAKVLDLVEEVKGITDALVKIKALDEKNAEEYVHMTRENAYIALEEWEDEE